MKKSINFDMDGTIANLYGVEGWLNDLQTGKTRPYEIAEPLYNMNELNEILTEADVGSLPRETSFRLSTWTQSQKRCSTQMRIPKD